MNENIKKNDVSERKNIFEYNFEGKKIIFEIDSLALKSNKSVLCRYNGSIVLTTLMVKKKSEKSYSGFPLTVFFDERFYAVGRIPNIFNKREVKGNYNSVKNARLIDRCLRSFFPIGSEYEAQITNIVLSSEKECCSVLAALWSSFLVCYISDDFFYLFENECLAAVMLAKDGNKIVFHEECKKDSIFNFEAIIAITNKKKIILLEAHASEISEQEIKNVIDFSVQKINQLISFFSSIQKKIKEQKDFSFLNENKKNNLLSEEIFLNIEDKLQKKIIEKINEVLSDFDINWYEKEKKIKTFFLLFLEEYFNNNVDLKNEKGSHFWEEAWNYFLKKEAINMINNKKVRLDNRGVNDIRDINIKMDFLSNRVHGSALFQRGYTQVLSSITTGKASEKQILTVIPSDKIKYFIHHYNFPHFSVGELDVSRNISRREIGHGELVEKTFLHLIPSINSFPHTIRVVSEVLSSDGSSSQASICSTSLALISSGIKLKRLAAGISLGMIGGEIIVDINALEDKISDMDFKIAGTKQGICSIQLDTKHRGINLNILDLCFSKAKDARNTILTKMEKCIMEKPRVTSTEIVKSKVITVDNRHIGLIIGQGGKMINSLKSTGASIEIQQDGKIFVYHNDEKELNNVCDIIMDLISKFR